MGRTALILMCMYIIHSERVTLCFQAVLVDMEEGVVSEMMKGPLKDVFDYSQLITDVSGSGNNW